MTNFQQCRQALTESACLEKGQTIEAIRAVAAVALLSAETVVSELLPEGVRKGTEWVARNPTRADRETGSFSVSLSDGRWHDFASSDGGGDLVSLAAYLWGVRQTDAARNLARRLGLHLGALESRPIDAGSAEAQRQRLAIARRETEQRNRADAANSLRRNQAAAQFARKLWQSATPASSDHVYLMRKQVLPCGLRQDGNDLLVPLTNTSRELINLQRIAADGTKRFLFGGQVVGAFHLIGLISPGCRLYVCEGWATGATLFEQYEAVDAVACAMNAGNLRPVALALRAKYGDRVELVIAGDDDRHSSSNPGRSAADAAALAAGALVMFPEWPVGSPVGLTDFNDLHTWEATLAAQVN